MTVPGQPVWLHTVASPADKLHSPGIQLVKIIRRHMSPCGGNLGDNGTVLATSQEHPMAGCGLGRGPWIIQFGPRPSPAHTQPGHHVVDGSEEFCFLFLRVGVIKAQETDPIVGLGGIAVSVSSCYHPSSYNPAHQTGSFSELTPCQKLKISFTPPSCI